MALCFSLFVEAKYQDNIVSPLTLFQVSEGLDFADRNGRAVVITGLPFPSAMDAKVQCNNTIIYMLNVHVHRFRSNVNYWTS